MSNSYTSLDPQEIRLEALRLAKIQAPGAGVTKSTAEILEAAKAFESFIRTGV